MLENVYNKEKISIPLKKWKNSIKSHKGKISIPVLDL